MKVEILHKECMKLQNLSWFGSIRGKPERTKKKQIFKIKLVPWSSQGKI